MDKTKARILGLLGTFVFFTGCAAIGPTGGLYTDMMSPQAIAFSSIYQITPDSDFESIAFVEGRARGTVILGIVATGNFGYGAAIEDALSKAPEATRLVDVTVDTHVKNVLGIYAEYTTIVRGRAIRTRR